MRSSSLMVRLEVYLVMVLKLTLEVFGNSWFVGSQVLGAMVKILFCWVQVCWFEAWNYMWEDPKIGFIGSWSKRTNCSCWPVCMIKNDEDTNGVFRKSQALIRLIALPLSWFLSQTLTDKKTEPCIIWDPKTKSGPTDLSRVPSKFFTAMFD